MRETGSLASSWQVHPDFVRNPRPEFDLWFADRDLIEHLLDGLCKAGLDTASDRNLT